MWFGLQPHGCFQIRLMTANGPNAADVVFQVLVILNNFLQLFSNLFWLEPTFITSCRLKSFQVADRPIKFLYLECTQKTLNLVVSQLLLDPFSK